MANFLSQIFFSAKVIPKLLLHERKKPLPIFFFLFHKLSHVYTASTHIALFVRPFEGEQSEEERERKKSLCPSIRPRSLFLRSRHRRRGELYSSSGRGGEEEVVSAALATCAQKCFFSLSLCLLSKKGAPAERGEERIERELHKHVQQQHHGRRRF